MTGVTANALTDHLLRDDGQEDVCLAIYQVSTGTRRRTALITDVILPHPGEREVHGNASFSGAYVVRAAAAASHEAGGVAILHSHPGGRGWQPMSSFDEDAERSYAYLAHEITGVPLLGLTLAGGDHGWSARSWSSTGLAVHCENVRILADRLSVSWNDNERPPPALQATQVRTASGWGDRVQASIARLRVLVVGAGSVGLEVAVRLVASGIENVAVMDFDTVEFLNLDRLIGATVLDARLHRAKTDVAHRLLLDAATAAHPQIELHNLSICELAGLSIALDYDVILSCVDRPWPRAVLNTIAYADLIPVIDGGIHIDPFPDEGMRNATLRSHVLRPGRPCLVCNKQLDLARVPLERDGSLDDPEYIRGAGKGGQPLRQNVATLSVGVVASLLAQFVSLVAAPGGLGEPGPVRYTLSTHVLEHLPYRTLPNCVVEASLAAGDRRVTLTGEHARANEVREARRAAAARLSVRVLRWADDSISSTHGRLRRIASKRPL